MEIGKKAYGEDDINLASIYMNMAWALTKCKVLRVLDINPY